MMAGKQLRVCFDEKEIDSLFKEMNQCQLPGVAVGIAVNGVAVYRKAFGLANMELPSALTPSMRMRIGSTTKHFTALAYLLLCEEGRAGLDDPIGKHVCGLHPVNQAVTVRQLISHTAGLRDPMMIIMLACKADDLAGHRLGEIIAFREALQRVFFH